MVNTSDLIGYASDPAFTLDKNMRVTNWNAGAQELLGYSETEISGQPCSAVLRAFYPTGEPLCSVLCEGRACITNGDKWGISNCLIRHKNGKMITVGISSLVLPLKARKEDNSEPVALIFLRKVNDGVAEISTEMPLRIFSLGTFGLAIAGNGLDVENWKRKKAAVVLKCLVSQMDKPVHRERLIEWIWPNADLDSGWPRLKVTISYLRAALRKGGASANIIETVGQAYLLRGNSVWMDSDAFCALVSNGSNLLKAENTVEALALFEEAESLYRGDFFEDELYAEWCAVERERLREIYLELLAGLAKCYIETGHFMTASRVCKLALSSDPCRENFVRILMECLVRQNRPDWARAHFISWRRALDQEYGLQPTEDTLAVYRRIVGEDNTDLRQTA
ncbi:hypothetical protein MNBD_ALPHA09-1108 [hydrothermal vent metagenome]|uniref:PAS domain-containing protein n=1 Tax=hydrothermal vent metagenome TaxID=652676 RepID=A0A3B0SVZ7_9ZZZZ